MSTFQRFIEAPSLFILTIIAVGCVGCASSAPTGSARIPDASPTPQPTPQPSRQPIQTVGYARAASSDEGLAAISTAPLSEHRDVSVAPLPGPMTEADLQQIIESALRNNPRLARLYREHQAALARAQYVDKLPDPKLGANIFAAPLETAAGSQRANMNLSQVLPWMARLNAQQRQACLEAMAIRAEYAAERLRVIASLRIGWRRLYVLDQQLETVAANQQLLRSLIDVANARIATGNASQGDVLLGTLELSKLEERQLTYRKQRRGVEAEINRLAGRRADIPIGSVGIIHTGKMDLDPQAVYQIAMESQPEIAAARLRAQATRWGVEVARLRQRPEFMVSANYFFTDDNRPATPIVHVGEDPWSVGIQASLPLGCKKYDAMRNEAAWRHQASHATVEELADQYDTLILDLMTEAERAAETASLYADTILPQARQTLMADQASYANGSVEFDRVIRDYRNMITLELGRHQAMGELAIANARIQQVAGRDLAIHPWPAPRRDGKMSR